MVETELGDEIDVLRRSGDPVETALPTDGCRIDVKSFIAGSCHPCRNVVFPVQTASLRTGYNQVRADRLQVKNQAA